MKDILWIVVCLLSLLSLFYTCVSSTHSAFPALLCQKVLSPFGEWPQLINTTGLDKRYTLSILTTLDDPEKPVYCSLQEEANTQFTFLDFVCSALERGKLHHGNYLIMENATIHAGSNILRILLALLSMAGVFLIYLPKYSPELNPCECIFGYVKDQLQNNRGSGKLAAEIAFALAHLSQKMLLQYYKHCLRV